MIFSKLTTIKGKKVAIGISFNKNTGNLEANNTIVLDKEIAENLVNTIYANNWEVSDLETKPKTLLGFLMHLYIQYSSPLIENFISL